MKLVELEPQIPAPFVILSSIYAALELWQNVESLRHVTDEKQLVKLAAGACLFSCGIYGRCSVKLD